MLLLVLLSEDISFPYHDLETARRIVFMPGNEL